MTDKPIPESYWVVPDQFLAGGYPASILGDETSTRQCLATLLSAGIDTFFDLTQVGRAATIFAGITSPGRSFIIVQLTTGVSIFKTEGCHLMSRQSALLDAIDQALAAGRKIYLHCWGGIGRTGTTVGCWLVRHGLTGEAALARLNALYQTSEQSRYFPRSPETDAQVLFVLDWKTSQPPPSSFPLSRQEKGRGSGINWHARFLQQAAWTRDLRTYLFERAGLAQAQRVLEVGCGTGAILSELTTLAATPRAGPGARSPGRGPPARSGGDISSAGMPCGCRIPPVFSTSLSATSCCCGCVTHCKPCAK